MYTTMHDFFRRPAPHSRFTARDLWTRPHLARQMLRLHLDQGTGLASRPVTEIESIVGWLDDRMSLRGRRLCDLGCGPGLYATRFAARGAEVTGVDFSRHSLDHAKAEAERSGSSVSYLLADYLEDPLPGGFDVVVLIYYDYCALSPQQREGLLARVRGMLKPGGMLVLDVVAMGSLAVKREETKIEPGLMGGFWAEGDYVGLQRTLLYAEEAVSLDRFLIIEPRETWQIFNWLQYFTPERLSDELRRAGFTVEAMMGSLAGEPLKDDGDVIGVLANR